MSGALDGRGQLTLMLRAHAGNSSRKDLAAFADEFTETRGILIINGIYFVNAERTDLFSFSVYRALLRIALLLLGSLRLLLCYSFLIGVHSL